MAKSTTPKIDAERVIFNELDKKYPTKTIRRGDVARLRCQTCNTKPQCELSPYAISRSSTEIFVGCKCEGKKVWLKLID